MTKKANLLYTVHTCRLYTTLVFFLGIQKHAKYTNSFFKCTRSTCFLGAIKRFFYCLLQDLPVEGRPSYVNCDLPEPRGSVPPVLLPQGGGRPVSGLPTLLPPLGRAGSGIPSLLPPLGRPGGGLPALSPPLVQAPAAPTLSLYLPPAPAVQQQPPTDPDTGSPSHQVK
jgi:hypothetical protein